MHYPVLLETELAKRWMLSIKTLRGWRQRNVGPRWYTLGCHVRYHVADILAFESSALPQRLALEAAEQHQKRTGKPGKSNALDDSPPPANFVDAKTIAACSKLPHYIFADPAERTKRKIPHLQAVGCVRYSPLAIWHWEQEQSLIGRKVPAEVMQSDNGNAVITHHCPTLPSALEDFPHTYQHPISKDWQ